jgi:hypothetical protein
MDYLQLELERIAQLPTMEAMIERVAGDEPVDLGEPAAEMIRSEREQRDAELDRRLHER